MKVILLQKVPKLGNTDDVKEVADGYALNFLFPRHLAVPAKEKLLNDLEAHKTKIAKAAERELKEQQALASKLDGLELKFAERVSAKSQLYSAVSVVKIIKKLEDMGYHVSKEQIQAPVIKSIGEHKVKIKFSHGLEAEVAVIVGVAK